MAGKSASFGKRGVAAPAPARFPARRASDHAPPAQPTAPVLPGLEPEADASDLDVFHASGIPAFTITLVVLLCVIFLLQIQHSNDLVTPLQPGLDSLKAMGAVNGQLVLGEGQWWRLLTAPLLHGSLSHLLGNCVALVIAGFLLEPLIGGPWFLALFVLAGLGGSAGSLAQNNPNVVSVGASGAIMGVMAMAFLVSSRAPDAKQARKMRTRSLVLGLPAILPVFLGPVHDHVDYGAHLGGFLAGGLVWMLQGLFWPYNERRPGATGLAGAIAAGGGIAALVAFGLAVADPPPALADADKGPLVPMAEFPRSDEDGLKRSADLVSRWPDDPRVHYLRALYFLGQRDLADAREHLRTGIALMPAHADDLKPELGYRMQMTLALIVRRQGDLAAARAAAAEACAATETRDWDLRAELEQQRICR